MPAPADHAPLLLDWQAHALQAALSTHWPGLQLQLVAETGSTNTDLLTRARTDTSACLRVAEHQHAGRGRQGKAWQSATGASLTFSLAAPLAPLRWDGLSLAIGLALAEALDPAASDAPPRIALKWPNDLLLQEAGAAAPGGGIGRKLGGILIETVASAGQRVAVIGIGLNVRPPPAPAPGQAGFSWGHASLTELQADSDAPAVLARVAPALLQAVRQFEAQGFAPLRARFARRDALLGRAVSTTLPGLPQGVADGVDADGVLWLRTTGAAGPRHPVISGEVSLRPADTPGGMPC